MEVEYNVRPGDAGTNVLPIKKRFSPPPGAGKIF
jgi:hypothetical protein